MAEAAVRALRAGAGHLAASRGGLLGGPPRAISARGVNRPWYHTKPMNFSIAYSWHNCGGVLVSPSELTSPGFPGTYPPDTYCAWRVDFDEGQQVLVTFDTWSFRPDETHDFVEIHNGDSSQAPKLGPLGGREPLHSMGRSLWIEFRSGPPLAQPPPGQGFKLTFSTTARACGGIVHGASGELSTPGFPRSYPAGVECVWEVRAEPGFGVALRFVDRFHVQEREGAAGACSADYVQLLDYDEARREWAPLGGRLCGRSPPAEPPRSSGSWLRVVFRSDAAGTAEGFKARWEVVCGFSRTLTMDAPRGEVLSPGFPLGYPPHLNCTYELRAPSVDQFILARFTNFSVEAARGCIFDNVTLIRTHDEDMSLPWVWGGGPHRAAYCDSRLPPALVRVRSRLLFTFQTDQYLQGMGFRLAYELNACHQAVTQPGVLEPPRDGRTYSPQTNCTWNITAPEGSLVFVRFTELEMELSYDCFADSLSVFDGPSANESTLLGRFCGDLSHEPPSLRSTGRSMLLRWVTDTSGAGRGFVALVRFQSATCLDVHRTRDPDRNRGVALARGAPLELVAGESVRVTASRFADTDCDWAVTAPSGFNVRLEAAAGALDALQRCPASNRTRDPCHCAFLQVADGLDAYSDLMGKFCPARPSPALTTSDRNMYLRLSAQRHRGAVSLTLRTVPAACGPTLIVFNKSEELVITSPGFPARPAPLLRCVWTVDLQNAAAVVNLTTVDLDGPAHCVDKDSPASHIATGRLDITRGTITTMRSNSKVHVGDHLAGVMGPGLHVINTLAARTMSFCGRERPPPIDLAAYLNGFKITYHSGEAPTGKGFQMRVKTGTACPPADLIEPSGTLAFTREEPNCVVRILAAVNQTISIFFGDASYIPPSTECAESGVEVRDGREPSSPLLGRLCSYDIARGFSSTGPAMLVRFWRKETNYAFVTAYYTTTDSGPGCGGRIYQDSGVFSSPMYPAPYRNASVCRWDVETPGAMNPALAFKAFDLGPNTSCDTDFVEIFDVDVEGREVKRAQYCGQEKPAVVRGNTHHMVVKYTTSVRNGGTGWLAEFKGLGSGERVVLN